MATTMQHPLQRKVDRILQKRLGSADKWQTGDTISPAQFSHIRNKSYVRSRLYELGFTFNHKCRYELSINTDSINTEGEYLDLIADEEEVAVCRFAFKSHRKSGRKDWVAKAVLKVPPRLRGVLRHLLLHRKINNRIAKTTDARKQLSTLISDLRRAGYVIDSSNEWDFTTGRKVTVYKLKTPISGV